MHARRSLAKAFTQRYQRPQMEFSFSFLVALLHYDWPFNVRELESCIKRGVALATNDVLDTPQLPDAIAEHMRGYGQRPRVLAPSEAPGAGGAGERPSVPPILVPSMPPPMHHAQPLVTPALRRSPPSEAELRALLEQHKGNVAAVGREFGKERMQMHRWLKKYAITLDEYRDGRGD